MEGHGKFSIALLFQSGAIISTHKHMFSGEIRQHICQIAMSQLLVVLKKQS